MCRYKFLINVNVLEIHLRCILASILIALIGLVKIKSVVTMHGLSVSSVKVLSVIYPRDLIVQGGCVY